MKRSSCNPNVLQQVSRGAGAGTNKLQLPALMVKPRETISVTGAEAESLQACKPPALTDVANSGIHPSVVGSLALRTPTRCWPCGFFSSLDDTLRLMALSAYQPTLCNLIYSFVSPGEEPTDLPSVMHYTGVLVYDDTIKAAGESQLLINHHIVLSIKLPFPCTAVLVIALLFCLATWGCAHVTHQPHVRAAAPCKAAIIGQAWQILRASFQNVSDLKHPAHPKVSTRCK